MTFNPARPHYTLPLAGRDYALVGTFSLIEAVELSLRDYVGHIAVRLVNGMPAHDLAKVLSAILTASGHATAVPQANTLLWDTGLAGEENDRLRLHLYSFLSICLSPPSQREEKTKAAGELLGSLAASRGKTTSASASASSAGPPTSSGKPPSGKSPKPTRAGP